MYEINWRGDKCKNYYNTRHTPIGICNHISAGTRESVFWWFTSPNNTQGSSNYLVSRKGEIDQYVDIRKSAWAQGLASDKTNYDRAISHMVRDRPMINPNYYLVSIEYEGYVEGAVDVNGNGIIDNYGLDGNLTEEQLQAGIWLHKWIQSEVERIWNHRISLNSYFVEGHFRIDPKRKPNCPGPNFPWNRLYTELAAIDAMTLEEYEERLLSKNGDNTKRATAYAIAERITELGDRLSDVKWGAAAAMKLGWLLPVMDIVGGEKTIQGLVKRVQELYQTSLGAGRFSSEADRKILLFEPIMRERGVL